RTPVGLQACTTSKTIPCRDFQAQGGRGSAAQLGRRAKGRTGAEAFLLATALQIEPASACPSGVRISPTKARRLGGLERPGRHSSTAAGRSRTRDPQWATGLWPPCLQVVVANFLAGFG